MPEERPTPTADLRGPDLGPPPVRETVSAAVYRRLRDALLAGRVPMGARINEFELATTWGISRTPIRDALHRLEAEGLVAAAPGRGMVVPVLTAADVDELYALREALEGMAARRAAEWATPQFLAQLNSLIKSYGAAVKQENLDQLIAADAALRDAIARMAQNGHLEQAIAAARLRVHHIHARSFRLKGRPGKTFREMAKIVAAIRTKNPPRAEAAMREHLAGLRTDITAAVDDLLAAESV